jgi:hypothetical protein
MRSVEPCVTLRQATFPVFVLKAMTRIIRIAVPIPCILMSDCWAEQWIELSGGTGLGRTLSSC